MFLERFLRFDLQIVVIVKYVAAFLNLIFENESEFLLRSLKCEATNKIAGSKVTNQSEVLKLTSHSPQK